MSKDAASALFSADLHELGTRLVDLLNQAGFLYRFPSVAGVTLACMAQHLEPVARLLERCRANREALGRRQSANGYDVGPYHGPDPLTPAYEYARDAFRTFVRHLLQPVPDAASPSHEPWPRLVQALGNQDSPDPRGILECRELIERLSEDAGRRAQADFQVLSEQDWQGLRMVLFFFLLELERSRNPDPS